MGAKEKVAAEKAAWLFIKNEAEEEKICCNVDEQEEENEDEDKTDASSDAGLDETQLSENTCI